MTSLFVSYSRKDIDWEDIPPTVEWWKEIEKGIEESGVFLFLISPDSVNSKYRKLI